MALELPTTATEVDQRMKVDVTRELPNANPFLKNSWLGALVTACANRVFDFYYALRQAEKEAIPDTAVINLEQWAAIWKILRIPATPAIGNIVVTGTIGGSIVTGADPSIWVASDGVRYAATSAGVIILQSLAVDTITESGGIGTLTTVSNHFIASSVLITVTGADQSEYNLTGVVCTVTGDKTLTYTVSGSPADATGTVLLGFTSVSIPVQSTDFGVDKNQVFDTVLTLTSPIVDVDDSASVDFGALGGGADQEVDSNLRTRLLDAIQNPISHFNVAEITAVAKSIAGVTRVFVEEVTPLVGQVTIYFMRDNDDDPIPDSSEVATVKAVIVDQIMPSNTVETDVIVAAPVENSTDFTFSAISPNTVTMKTAIENSLNQFFAERTDVGVNIVEEAYNAAIFNTVDLITGAELESFTLDTPSADITIDTGPPAEIGTLGNVTFS
jgi:uncharacterized phage protein gp47/JayE